VTHFKATPERLTTFSDGVFAVLITILVLDLRPPQFPTFDALLSLWPTWLSYAVSYGFIAIVWAARRREAIRQLAHRHPSRSCGRALKVQNHVLHRFRAAHQDVALGWWIQRLGSIFDAAVQQAALARVAHAGSARPTRGHVARLGKRQQTAKS
jgi:hypothetical protein